jgi:hypothetical protein
VRHARRSNRSCPRARPAGRGHAWHGPHHKLILIKTQDMPGPSGRRERLMDSATQQATMHGGARLNICRLVLAIVQTITDYIHTYIRAARVERRTISDLAGSIVSLPITDYIHTYIHTYIPIHTKARLCPPPSLHITSARQCHTKPMKLGVDPQLRT